MNEYIEKVPVIELANVTDSEEANRCIVLSPVLINALKERMQFLKNAKADGVYRISSLVAKNESVYVYAAPLEDEYLEEHTGWGVVDEGALVMLGEEIGNDVRDQEIIYVRASLVLTLTEYDLFELGFTDETEDDLYVYHGLITQTIKDIESH